MSVNPDYVEEPEEPLAITKEHRKLFEYCWLPALGLLVSFSEFIVTSVYQFYFVGFALSFIIMIASGVLLHLKFRDYRIWEKG